MQYTQVIYCWIMNQFKHNCLFIYSSMPPISLSSLVIANDRCITYKNSYCHSHSI